MTVKILKRAVMVFCGASRASHSLEKHHATLKPEKTCWAPEAKQFLDPTDFSAREPTERDTAWLEAQPLEYLNARSFPARLRDRLHVLLMAVAVLPQGFSNANSLDTLEEAFASDSEPEPSPDFAYAGDAIFAAGEPIRRDCGKLLADPTFKSLLTENHGKRARRRAARALKNRKLETGRAVVDFLLDPDERTHPVVLIQTMALEILEQRLRKDQPGDIDPDEVRDSLYHIMNRTGLDLDITFFSSCLGRAGFKAAVQRRKQG